MSQLISSQVELTDNNFFDAFDNSSLHSAWTQDIGSSSFVEDSAKLTFSDAGSSQKEWLATQNAPSIWLPLEPRDFTAMVHVRNLVDASTCAGGLVHYRAGTKSDYNFIGYMLNNTPAGDQIYTHHHGANDQALDVPTYLYHYVALARRGGKIIMAYSNTVHTYDLPSFDDMTFVRSFTNDVDFNDNRIAITIVTKATSYPAIDVEFRNFSLTYP